MSHLFGVFLKMRNMKFHITLMIVCFFMLYSCGSKKEHSVIFLEGIIDNSSTVYCGDYFDSIYYLPLETDSNCYIKEISKLICIDSSLFILDKKSERVLKYSKEGDFDRQIGSYGRGPSEYLQLADIEVDRDNKLLFVLSYGAQKLLKYDLAGHFIESFSLTTFPDRIYIDHRGIFLYTASGGCVDGMSCVKIYYLSTDFKTHRPLVSYSETDDEFKYKGLKFVAGLGCNNGRFTEFVFPTQMFHLYDDDFNLIQSYEFKFGKSDIDMMSISNNNDILRYSSENGFVDNVLFTRDLFFVETICKNRMGNLIISSKDMVGYNAEFDFETIDRALYNDIDGGFPFWPIGKINDSILYSTFDLNMYRRYTDRNNSIVSQVATNKELRNKFYEMIDTLSAMSNPVIQFARLK